MKFAPTFLYPGGQLLACTKARYSQLVAAFGEPNRRVDGYKTCYEWAVRNLKTGDAFTIYDYDGKSKLKDTDEEYEWHIGGRNYDGALALIQFIQDVRTGRTPK